MKRNLAELSNREFDVVIVGGGAFGACAAWEAASRGLSVALIEKHDFCQSTSANHGKFVHGGIRYLQHLDWRRVRESCRERSALLRIAPHLVQPLPIVMPTFGRGREGRFVLGSGLKLYDAVVFDRNSGIRDPDRRIPRGRVLNRRQFLSLFPDLDAGHPSGAGLFYDGQFYNPPRLVLAFLQSAVNSGACVANYVSATGLLRNNGRVHGVNAKDELGGDDFEIRGRIVLNAAGPWAPELVRRALNIEIQPTPRFSRDAGFIIKGRRTGNHALACRLETSDPDAILTRRGRHVFLAPWRDYTYVGTWHVVHTKDVNDVSVRREEIEAFIEEVNLSQPGLQLRMDDVTLVHSGLTLFGENTPGEKNLRFGHRSLLLDHKAEDGIDGLVTLIGIRATMARGVAERAIDLILRKLGASPKVSLTDRTPLHGGAIEAFERCLSDAIAELDSMWPADIVRSLVHNYGSEYRDVAELARSDSTLVERLGQSSTVRAQIVFGLRYEMAQSLGDVVFRRTDLGTGGHPGQDALHDCGRIVANTLGWDEERLEREMKAVLERFPGFTL